MILSTKMQDRRAGNLELEEHRGSQFPRGSWSTEHRFCQAAAIASLAVLHLTQLLQVSLGDQSFDVSLPHVELAVLGQSDGPARIDQHGDKVE